MSIIGDLILAGIGLAIVIGWLKHIGEQAQNDCAMDLNRRDNAEREREWRERYAPKSDE